MKLSYVIVTHNRREPLLKTLRHLFDTTPYSYKHFEVWVVDNASTDGTEQAVRAAFPQVSFMKRKRNEGVWARSHAFGPATGEYLILLDDDSYPINDAVTRSLSYLDGHPKCAAVVGKVVLPDGSEEGCALPGVMLSGAVCIRKSVLSQVGGFRPEFFRKAGEYDLSYRIWQAGFSIERFDDIVYNHDKVLTGRSKPFAHRMDLRNNLILVERYLPKALRAAYRKDVIQRYTALAKHDGCGSAALLARAEGLIWRLREMRSGRQTLSAEVVEQIYQIELQAAEVRHFVAIHSPAPVDASPALKYCGSEDTAGTDLPPGTVLESDPEMASTPNGQNQIKRVVIADFSKNLFATFQACDRSLLSILAIADDNPAYAGLTYRGVPVLPLEQALTLTPDAVIVSNINPAQSRLKAQKVREKFAGPVLSLWQPQSTREVAGQPFRAFPGLGLPDDSTLGSIGLTPPPQVASAA